MWWIPSAWAWEQVSTFAGDFDENRSHRALALAAGDVDGDGRAEAIVVTGDRWGCEPCAARVHVYWGIAGGFSSPSVLDGPAPEGEGLALVLADADADGIGEVVVAAGEALRLYADARSFDDGEDLDGFTSILALGSGDLDGDGYEDLVVADAGAVLVYAGSASGFTFAGSLGLAPTGLAVGDDDGDGYDDVAVGVEDGVELYRGGPDGLAGGAAWHVDLTGGGALAFADDDDDGDLDLWAAAPGALAFYRWPNEGSPGAAEAFPGDEGHGACVLAAGDVDGDGRAELLGGSPDEGEGGRADLLGSGLEQSLWGDPAEALRCGAAPGDVDGDGLADLLLASDRSLARLHLGSAAGLVTTPSQSLRAEVFDGGFGARLAGRDLDGDGDEELLAGAPDALGEAPGAGAVWALAGGPYGPEPRSWSLLGTTADAGHAVLAELGDVDGDGQPELGLADSRATASPGSLSLLGADLVELARHDRDCAGSLGPELAGGDLDGDGLDEVAIGGHPGEAGCGEALLLLRDASLDSLAALDEPLQALAAGGDVDGDGYGDLASAEAGGLRVWRGGASGPSEWTTAETEAAAVELADLDGDGFADLVLGLPGEAEEAGRVELRRGGSASLEEAARVSGIPGDRLGASLAPLGDLDADGAIDFVIAAPGDDAAWVCLAELSRCTLLRGEPGEGFGAAVRGVDLDGDGVDEIAVGAPTANEVRIYRPSDWAEAPDSGETGDSGDSGDSGETGDSGDSADSTDSDSGGTDSGSPDSKADTAGPVDRVCGCGTGAGPGGLALLALLALRRRGRG